MQPQPYAAATVSLVPRPCLVHQWTNRGATGVKCLVHLNLASVKVSTGRCE